MIIQYIKDRKTSENIFKCNKTFREHIKGASIEYFKVFAPFTKDDDTYFNNLKEFIELYLYDDKNAQDHFVFKYQKHFREAYSLYKINNYDY